MDRPSHLILAALALVSTPALAADRTQLAGRWFEEVSKDAMTDAPETTVYVEAGNDARLMFHCSAGKPMRMNAAFVTREYLGSSTSSPRGAMFRVDGAEAVDNNDWIYGDHFAAPLYLKQFTSAVIGGSKLVARLYTYRGQTIDVAFDITGSTDAISRVYDACAEKLPKR